ncbi:MAG: N-acetyltransferase, partial [Proteobacteria bacterium]
AGRGISELVGKLTVDPTAQPSWSLVATKGVDMVGHVLFTTARLQRATRSVGATILAPLSVSPEQQGQSIGTRLVDEGLRTVREAGVDLVFVLGHPGFYSRFGFAPAGALGFDAPYPIPPHNAGAWMVHALRPDLLGRVSGRVICADALDDPGYWRE